MVALSLLIFVLITTVNPDFSRQRLSVNPSYRQNWMLGFFRFYQAFIVHGEVLGGTVLYLVSLRDPEWVAQAALYALSRVFMDTLLVCTHTPTALAATDPISHAGRSFVCYLELEPLDHRPPHHHSLR